MLIALVGGGAAPVTASANDCVGVSVEAPADRERVRGRVVAVSWTSVPCEDPESHECAVNGGVASEEAEVTVEVAERWGTDGEPVAREPGTLRLVGAASQRPACGPPIGEGAELVFVLGEAVDGGFRFDSAAPWTAPAGPASATEGKGSSCAGCGASDPGAGLALVALVGWGLRRRSRRAARR